MKLAVLSDTDDNVRKVNVALHMMAHAVVHCDDLCSPFVVGSMATFLPDTTPVHNIWGNNEGDIRLICMKATEHENITLHGDFASLNFHDLQVALTHYPTIARSLAASGHYQLVCYGHNRCAHRARTDNCILLNPVELLGLKGNTSLAWFQTITHTVQFVNVL